MRQYAAPPLVEAICAFQFVPGQPWDATVLGLVYRLKKDFPDKQQAPGSQFSVTIGTSPPASTERMRFISTDKRALVQVGPNTLTVNHLTPYSGWPVFCEMIENVLDAYKSVAAPHGLQSIGLRYINRINVPASQADATDGNVEIQQYVRTHPVIPASLPPMFLEWAQRVVIPFESVEQTLVLQSGTAPGNDEFPVAFVLDLEARPAESRVIALAEAGVWLEKAHTNVENVFENCLGPKARQLFEEKTKSAEKLESLQV